MATDGAAEAMAVTMEQIAARAPVRAHRTRRNPTVTRESTTLVFKNR